MVQDTGNWDLDRFSQFIPTHLTNCIFALPPPSNHSGTDELKWNASPEGEFSSKSTFLAIHKPIQVPHLDLFPCIWKWRGSERRFPLWKAMHNKLMTNLEQSRKHLTSSSTCPLCGLHNEILFPCFRDCQHITTLWFELLCSNQSNFFSNMDWFSWLASNITDRVSGITSQNWSLTFGVLLDVIWTARNDFVFNQKSANTQQLLRQTISRFDSVLKVAQREQVLGSVYPHAHFQIPNLADTSGQLLHS